MRPLRARRSGAAAPSRAARKANAASPSPAIPDASSPEFFAGLTDADFGTRARTLTRIQQERGNAWVQRLVKGPRPKADGDGAKVKPDAAALIQAQYANLAKLLEPEDVARLQRLIPARFALECPPTRLVPGTSRA